MKLLFGILWAAARFGLFVGSNGAPDGREPLRHAEADAARVRQVFIELGGMDAADGVLLESPDADELRRAIGDLSRRASDKPGALFVFYYSGHADDRALLLGGSELAMSDLASALESVPSQLALHLIDACRSGALTRLKGAAAGERFSLRARPAGEGRVVIASSAEWEDAQESDRLGGSFFTVHLASGLRGAADGDADGEVTLAEAYAYVYGRTVESTIGTIAGPQHPTFRYDMRGNGELVLTWPGTLPDAAILELSGGADWLVVDGATGRVSVEVRARAAGERVALRPGDYRLSKRTPNALWDGEVRLSPRGRASGDDHLTRRAEHARLVRKGLGGAPLVSHAILAGGGIRGPIGDLSGPAPFFRAAYALSLPWLTFVPHASFSPPSTQLHTPRLTYQLDEIAVGVEIRRSQDFGFLTASAGLLADVLWLRQNEIAGREPSRAATGFALGAGLSFEVSPIDGLLLAAGAEVDTYTFRLSRATRSPADEGELETSVTYRAFASIGWEP